MPRRLESGQYIFSDKEVTDISKKRLKHHTTGVGVAGAFGLGALALSAKYKKTGLIAAGATLPSLLGHAMANNAYSRDIRGAKANPGKYFKTTRGYRQGEWRSLEGWGKSKPVVFKN